MKKLFSLQVAEQTIYFPLFAEQSFFTKKHSPPPGIKLPTPLDTVLLHPEPLSL